jgi:FkbM family methyltransferase
VGVLAKTLLRVARATRRPEGERWDPAWHIGPLRDPTRAETRYAAGWIWRHRRDLRWLHSRLADSASRDLLVDLLAHRLVGGRRVAFGPPRGTREGVTRFMRGCAGESLADGSVRYDLLPVGLDLSVRAYGAFAIQTFVLEQYRHPDLPAANVRPGDHVVDGGAFWGDTALWLAEQCAPDGVVHAFEMDPANHPVLEENLRENASTGARVRVRHEALWDRRERLGMRAAGAGSSVAGGGEAAEATTLDALVEAGALERVDFVKLDIEGAELRALMGSQGTIRRFRPRFAVAAYHHWEDLFELARWIAWVEPSYRFALTHQSLHQYDTVLFAWPGERPDPTGSAACPPSPPAEAGGAAPPARSCR